MRAEIVNLDPETNPKLKEIFDLLLIAGYFRIRIPSIQPLDKVLFIYYQDTWRIIMVHHIIQFCNRYTIQR